MNTSKTFWMACCASFLITITSCKKDDSSSSDNSNTTKTLDKAKLVGKKWYNQGNTISHDFRANGVYGVGGTWEWVNNSDTMKIDLDGAGTANNPEKWKFFWSADHEMACKGAGWASGEILFKDQKW